MKAILGVVLIIAGIISGLYFGVWWAFIGGIIQVIEQIRAEHLVAVEVAIGVAKVVFAGLIGWASAFVLILPGAACLKDK